MYYGPSNGGFSFTFNFARAPFDDRRMREAVVRAIDVRALAASQYGNQLVGSDSLFAADSAFHTAAASQSWPAYDPQRAREHVAEHVADGGSARFTFKTSRSEVTLGGFELVGNGTSFEHPYPAAARLLHTDGALNLGGYTSPEVDRRLDHAASTADQSRRTADYQEVERLVNNDLALLFLNRSYMSTITRPDVRGIERYLTRDLFYADMWLDR